MIDDKKLYAELLRYSLMEIRSLEDTKLHRARDIANIIHNIPTALASGNADWSQIGKSVIERARFHGLEPLIEGLLKHIRESSSNPS